VLSTASSSSLEPPRSITTASLFCFAAAATVASYRFERDVGEDAVRASSRDGVLLL
jgi:hypothetical protein